MTRKWLPRRMQPQLMLLISVILLFAISLHSAFTLRQQLLASRASIENQANALVRNLAIATAKPLVLGSLDELDEFLLGFIDFPDVMELQISNTQGQILSHVRRTSQLGGKTVINQVGTRLALPSTNAAQVVTQTTEGPERMIAWYPVLAGKQLGWIRGQFSTDALDTVRRQVWTTMLISTALAIIGSSSLLYLFLRRPMRALEHARRFAVALDRSQGQRLTLLPAPEELEDLQAALNYASTSLHRQHLELDEKIMQLEFNERVLGDRNAQLGAIFALSPDGFVSFDGNHRVRYASLAFGRLTGLTEAEIVGMDEETLSDRLAGLCIESARFGGIKALQSLEKVAGDDKPILEMIELAGHTSRVLQVGLRSSHTQTVSQVLYVRDVTHEIEVDRMKSEFLSTAAHELRTPMASIYGFSELLLDQDFDEATRREFLQIIFRQSELMVSIINELLDLARIEARRGKDFVFETLNLAEVVDQAVKGFKPPGGRELPVILASDIALLVSADRNKLQQAIANLLSNAYKFSPEGGVVSIRYGQELMGDKTMVGVAVSDHGIGMTAQQQARIFERFYRADASGKIPGTGLGMSIVKEIVEIHRGRVDVQSEYGQGATFTVWLPCKSA